MPITILPLETRPNEIDRIIDEYARDAIAELGAPRTIFGARDREWVREHAASSLPEIEKATLRVRSCEHERPGVPRRLGRTTRFEEPKKIRNRQLT